jgi:adenylylsulfate kinase
MKNLKPCVIWFTGFSGAGKSSIAFEVEKQLNQLGISTSCLDGDIVRNGLCKDLDFSQQDREENTRRIGHVAHQMVNAGLVVLCAVISPFRASREKVRGLFDDGQFIEVFVDVPLAICEKRDVKGLYKKARTGEIKYFTGLDSPYEPPVKPEIHLISQTVSSPISISVEQVIQYLSQQ